MASKNVGIPTFSETKKDESVFKARYKTIRECSKSAGRILVVRFGENSRMYKIDRIFPPLIMSHVS